MNPWHLLFWLSVTAIVVAATFGFLLAGTVAWCASWVAFVELFQGRPCRVGQSARRHMAR